MLRDILKPHETSLWLSLGVPLLSKSLRLIYGLLGPEPEEAMTTNDSKADVVIIGAGIVGCCTAYYLAKKGVKVAIVEKGEVAGEQSSRAWGWVRQQGRNPREIPLVTFSKGLWSGLTDEIGADVEWIEEGSLKLAYTEEDLSHFEEWAQEARVLGLDTRVLTRDEVKREIPALEGAFVGGIHTPSDGQTEPRARNRGDSLGREGERSDSAHQAGRGRVRSGGWCR